MKRKSFLTATTLLLLLPSATSAADILEHIPDTALAALRVASVDETISNFRRTATEVGDAAMDAHESFATGVTALLELSDSGGLDAIDRDSPVYVVLFPFFQQATRPAAVLVSTKDETRLRRIVMGIAADGDRELKVQWNSDETRRVSRHRKLKVLPGESYVVDLSKRDPNDPPDEIRKVEPQQGASRAAPE